MADIERLQPVFRGVNNYRIPPEDFIQFFTDIFDLPLYASSLKQSLPTLKPTLPEIQSNQEFWEYALKDIFFENQTVRLKKFHLTQWIPAAPGRYFTPRAEEARNEAKHYLSHNKREYLPLGKVNMILGGVGSLRLSAKDTGSKTFYILGASSTGISHQGIPIALPEREHDKLIPTIKSAGGCVVNITGSLRIIPPIISLPYYERQIPKFYIVAQDIEFVRKSHPTELLATAAIMFPSHDGKRTHTREGYRINFSKSWSFCSFTPSIPNSLNKAVGWLREYAQRYSGIDDLIIVSDFDEYYEHFTNPIEFPIKNVCYGDIDQSLFYEYMNYYKSITGDVSVENISIETVMGDAFVNNPNSTFITNPAAGSVIITGGQTNVRQNIDNGIASDKHNASPTEQKNKIRWCSNSISSWSWVINSSTK